MKGFILICVSLASVALAAPSLKRADAVTTQQLDNLKLFSQWSMAAYCNSDKPVGQPVSCPPGICSFASHNATTTATFEGKLLDMRGFVAVDPVAKQIVLSFRGSSSIRNWIADLAFPQIPCTLTPDCLVHTGFDASWGEVASKATAGVRAAKAAHPDYSLIVTGHSLGGAVATLAAAHLRAAGFPADLYTYGSPRVGNDAFVRFVTNQPGGEFRVTHIDDPVPRLPPILVNFRHTSPEFWINAPGQSPVAPSGIKMCAGDANVQCNAGTHGLDVDAHLWYFQPLNGCSSKSLPFRSDGQGLSDAELEAKLNHFVDMDVQAAAKLHTQKTS